MSAPGHQALTVLERQYRQQRCFAEVGRPGHFHQCRRRWTVKVEWRDGYALYCKQHAPKEEIQ